MANFVVHPVELACLEGIDNRPKFLLKLTPQHQQQEERQV